jgi:hypothetical protein
LRSLSRQIGDVSFELLPYRLKFGKLLDAQHHLALQLDQAVEATKMRNCSRVMMRYLSRLRRSDKPIGCAELRFLATSCSFPGRSPERDSAVTGQSLGPTILPSDHLEQETLLERLNGGS